MQAQQNKPFYRSRTLAALLAVLVLGGAQLAGIEQQELAELGQVIAALLAVLFRVVAKQSLQL